MLSRPTALAAVLLAFTGPALAGLLPGGEKWGCVAGWPSETGRYEAPRSHARDMGVGFGSDPAIKFSVADDDDYQSFFAALNATQPHLVSQVSAEDKECCRPTWECYDFLVDERKTKEHIVWDDELARKKAYCCIGRYMLTCSKPQLGHHLYWLEPPACSNRDIQSQPPALGYPSG